MSQPIENYALIGDTHTTALVGLDGSIDWLCLPRFEDGACFAALLGDEHHGRWQLAPAGEASAATEVSRRYVDDTLVLETTFTTPDGEVRLVDFMPVRAEAPVLVRVVAGVRGTVRMAMDLRIRFDYGSVVPWVRKTDGGITAVGASDGLVVRSPIRMTGRDHRTVAEFDVVEGDRVPFTLSWFESDGTPPSADDIGDPLVLLQRTVAYWRDWTNEAVLPDGPWRDAMLRSIITLKALTFAPSGGVCAAATTSLPEWIGGTRNWDYRYCWLRDATFTLHALLDSGYLHEADEWAGWLRRSVAGEPDKLQIMYGIDGRRRLTEERLHWLPGYERSAPVRVGNAASQQFQLDVYGETLDMLHTLVERDRRISDDATSLAKSLVTHVRKVWRQPDEGIWEIRGPRRHFVHSKVMAWVAIDRWISVVERTGREHSMPLDEWRALADEIHGEICDQGIDPDRGCFVQYYGATEVDASLLMLPLVGFLPPDDPRIVATIAAVEEDLLVDGFVLRYRTDARHRAPEGGDGEGAPGDSIDGLPPGEGAFLLTTYWLVDNLQLAGRHDDAVALFERLLDLRNDVGLLSEEWDPHDERLVGNFPQAFSHVGLINSANNLTAGVEGPAMRRRGRRGRPTGR
jgi:GH15 family glucan-1,4-alpha-glucosidase